MERGWGVGGVGEKLGSEAGSEGGGERERERELSFFALPARSPPLIDINQCSYHHSKCMRCNLQPLAVAGRGGGDGRHALLHRVDYAASARG